MRVRASVLWAALALHQPAQAFAPLQVRRGPGVVRHRSNHGKTSLSPLYMSTETPVESEKKTKESPVDPPSTAAGAPTTTSKFENDGLFAWMQPYIKVMGFVEGNTLVGAVPVKASVTVDSNETARLRQEFTDALQNIGPEERARRDQIGNIFLVLSVIYGAWASLIADDGGPMGHVLRSLLSFPLFFAAGFKLSAQNGL